MKKRFSPFAVGVIVAAALQVTAAAAALAVALSADFAVADDLQPRDTGFEEHVTVTATRLPDREAPRDEVPATVTVITREQIQRSGTRTIQELLSTEAGVIVYDQIGNGIQTTLDLRGFAGGTGTAVYLDGARLNDPRNNTVALELVPIDAIDRIEIVRGSTAALAGGGSEAGVVQIITRRGEATGGSIRAGAGTHGSPLYGGTASLPAGRFDLFASAVRDETDGFRENSAGDQKRLSATAGYDLGGNRRVSLSLLSTHSDFGAPGALTEAELERDRTSAPFNSLDGSTGRLRLASLNFHGPLAGGFSLAANVFGQDQRWTSLTTGRSAPAFGYGGFFLDYDTSLRGSTAQLSHLRRWGSRESSLTFGAEWLDGHTRSLGFFTPLSDPSRVDRASPGAVNDADRGTLALFLQEAWKPAPAWTLTAGLRYDRDRIGFDQRVPAPTNAGSRRFSKPSARAGAAWNPRGRIGFYASYGEAFLPPTAEQLFSFPGFFGNPSLRPEDSRSYEIGARGRWSGARLSADVDGALYVVDTSNEIIFDSSFGPNGGNVNADRTRRRGLEVSTRARLARRLGGFLNLSWTDAEFRNGPNRGKTVPLVPGNRQAIGFDCDLPAGFRLRSDAVRAGSEVLDSDDANAQKRLAAYTVVNLRASWSRRLGAGAGGPAARGGGSAAGGGSRPELTTSSPGLPAPDWSPRVTLFVEARNLFDARYATRGIFTTDYSACDQNFVCPRASFFTPAPGRRYLAGAEWSF